MAINMQYKNLHTSCSLPHVYPNASTADLLTSHLPVVGLLKLQSVLAAKLFCAPVSTQSWQPSVSPGRYRLEYSSNIRSRWGYLQNSKMSTRHCASKSHKMQQLVFYFAGDILSWNGSPWSPTDFISHLLLKLWLLAKASSILTNSFVLPDQPCSLMQWINVII